MTRRPLKSLTAPDATRVPGVPARPDEDGPPCSTGADPDERRPNPRGGEPAPDVVARWLA